MGRVDALADLGGGGSPPPPCDQNFKKKLELQKTSFCCYSLSYDMSIIARIAKKMFKTLQNLGASEP